MVENTLTSRLRWVNTALRQRRNEHIELARGEASKALCCFKESLAVGIGQFALGQRFELAGIVRPGPGMVAIGVSIGHAALARDHTTVFQRNNDLAAKSALVRIGIEIAHRPGRLFHRADLVPQRHGRRRAGALACIGVDMVPFAIFERDRQDIHDRVIKRFA